MTLGLVMNAEEAKERLEPFAYKYDGRKDLKNVAFRGGKAYASNGSIAVVADVTGEIPDEIEDFPYDKVDGFFKNGWKPSSWYRIDPEQAKPHFDKLMARARKEESKSRYDWNGRYKYASCPSCAEELWWDTWSDKLVAEREEYIPDEYESIDMNAEVAFGGAMTLVVKLGYMYKIMKALGGDAMFSYSELDDKPVVLVKSADGSVRAILCPCRVGRGDFKPDVKLDAAEVK